MSEQAVGRIYANSRKSASDFIDDIYSKLKNLYNFLKHDKSKNEKKDSSILSLKITQFLNSFELMVNKFKMPNLI